jgi:type IV pilus assembly protein PilB
MAQRLCRRLCNCKVTVDVHKETLLAEGFAEADVNDPSFKLYGPRPGGCEKCSGSGYKGRAGIYQVMPISDAMKRLIMEGRNAVDLADQARVEGIWDLRQSGLSKVKQGLTSLEEVNRVAKGDE